MSDSVDLRPRVLVADDDPTVRELLQRALERDGLPVTLANNGIDALEAIGRHDFSVVLLDVHMPVMRARHGLYASPRRSSPDGPSVPALDVR
jgi:CheY-like chemotaxis protein